MLLNIPSKILLNLIIPEIDRLLKEVFNDTILAISPTMNYQSEYFNYNLISIIHIKTGKKDLSIYIFTDNIHEEIIGPLNEHIKSNLYQTSVILSILFKKNYDVELITNSKENKNIKELNLDERKRIDISVRTKKEKDREYYFSILIPIEFLNLFSKNIKPSSDSDFTDTEILNFFENPINLLPSIKTILDRFNNSELQKLLFQLRDKNLLTTYQIYLLKKKFPEYSLKIKNNISSNTIHDVQDLNKMIELDNINKRDLIEGVYSVEEAIYMLMKKNEDFSYSRFLSKIQDFTKTSSNITTLLKKEFSQWIKEMVDSGLFYSTISITKEIDIARSISDKTDFYKDIIAKYISEKRIVDIISLVKDKKIQYFERIESQSKLLSNYRKLKIDRLKPDADSFNILLSRTKELNRINNLLLSVGWFILSTALKPYNKKVDSKKVIKITEGFPIGARYLIIDVIQGIVNPNIIHDEIQIKRAREICVKAIISLFEDGIFYPF